MFTELATHNPEGDLVLGAEPCGVAAGVVASVLLCAAQQVEGDDLMDGEVLTGLTAESLERTELPLS